MFHSIEKAKSFSEKEKLFLEKEIVLYDFTKVIDMADHISNSEDCRILFNTWNSPCFDDDERKKIILILKNGLSILDRGDLRHAQ